MLDSNLVKPDHITQSLILTAQAKARVSQEDLELNQKW